MEIVWAAPLPPSPAANKKLEDRKMLTENERNASADGLLAVENRLLAADGMRRQVNGKVY